MNSFRSTLHTFRYGILLCGVAAVGTFSLSLRAQVLDPTSVPSQTSTMPTTSSSSSTDDTTLSNPAWSTSPTGDLLNQYSTTTVATPQVDEQGRVIQNEDAQQLRASQNQPRLTAEPPSPFQEMVEATTGEKLEIYGASMFRRVPTTFSPVQNTPVGPGYVLGPGDQVRVQLAGQVNRQFNLVIDREGSILIPEVGAVHVAGLTYGELQDYLNKQLGRIYRNFTVSATLGRLRNIQVFVVGQARRPGSFAVSSLSTLVNALFASGGPLATGSLRDIQVKRNGQTIVHFDLYDLLLHGDKSKDIPLATGDVIFIPFAGPQVAVLGSVNHPAIYELKGQTSIDQALALAGGESSIASGADVLLERVFDHANRSVETVSLDQAKTEMMQGGDILSVRAVVDRFRNAVTLRGNVANPGRYAWKPGMRVSDLIPNKESLVTREYWRKRNQLGQFVLDQGEMPDRERLQRDLQKHIDLQRQLRMLNPPAPGQAGQAADTQNSDQTAAGQTQAAGAGTATGVPTVVYDQEGVPVTGPEASILQQAQAEGSLQMGNRVNERPQGNGTGGGSSAATALTGGSTRFRPKNDVVLSAPDIDWGYAVIERQDAKTLTTSLIPFNLGKIVLDGDKSQDAELLPGDVVTIFSKADIRVPSRQQTRYVRLEGEIEQAGVYSVQPGETLRSLLRRAGGFTPDAYLYASAFTRESTRRLEKQRLNDYADQLESQLSMPNVTPESQIAIRAAVTRLRGIEPLGRIVLELKPDSAGIDSVPDIALEDGDRFVVPRIPSNVTVEGQVYSANAFLYRPGKRAKVYLHQAGGPDRQADHKRMFILRADGSVVSQQYADVKNAPIYPGDTIVVPANVRPKNGLQQTLAYAQIAGNLALSAASLAVIAKQ